MVPPLLDTCKTFYYCTRMRSLNPKVKTLFVRVSESVYEQVESLAEARGMASLSELVRLAVIQYIDNVGEKRTKKR